MKIFVCLNLLHNLCSVVHDVKLLKMKPSQPLLIRNPTVCSNYGNIINYNN